jgi:hypothetical protein
MGQRGQRRLLLDRAEHHPGTAQHGLAQQGGGRRVLVRFRAQARRVHLQHRETGLPQRGGGHLPGTAARPFAQVAEPYVGPQRAHELADVGRGDLVHHAGDTGQRRVRQVVAQQVVDHPVRHAQRAGQERPLPVVHHEQPGRPQRCRRVDPRPARRRRLRQPAQPQRQARGRASPRDVVVQVAVELLEPAVHVRREGHQQQLDVQPGQPGGLRQPPQPAGRRRGLERHERLAPGRQQGVDRLVGQVEAAERVVRVGVGAAPCRHRRPDPPLQRGQPGEHVGQAAGVHGCLRLIATRCATESSPM